MKDKNFRKLLFGNHKAFGKQDSRGTIIKFPAKEDEDIERKINFASDDGVILYLLKRIEKLEQKNIKPIKK